MYDMKNKTQAVLDFQNMLEEIGRYDSRIPLVHPDGIYDEETADAVEAFCKNYGLPPRRTVDHEVYRSVADTYRSLRYYLGKRERPDLFPTDLAGGVLSKDERAVTVYYIQSMLAEMGDVCDEYAAVSINGTYDDATEKALSRLRKDCGIGKENTVDIVTWNALCREYNERKSVEM